MKILFVASHLPYPLHSGGQVRIYNLLSRVSKHHEVSLFTFLRSPREKEYIKALSFLKKIETVHRGYAWQPQYVLKSLLSSYPLLFATYAIKEMEEKISRELSDSSYDLIHIEPGYVWPSLPVVNHPLVVASHNIEYIGYKGYVDSFRLVPFRPFLMVDVGKLKWWEERIWKKATTVITVSQEDKEVIDRVVSPKNVRVVSNGVDVEEFPFAPNKINSSALKFLFVGNLSWLQNRDAVRFLVGDIWPLLKTKYPDAKLSIVGRQAPSDLASYIRESGATLHEGVNNIADEYQGADVLLAPIRLGSGSRYKILEAMASGLAVVTTDIGAGGLLISHKKEVMIGNTPGEFFDATVELVENGKLKDLLVKAARKKIESSYSWEKIAQDLESVWEDACRT